MLLGSRTAHAITPVAACAKPQYLVFLTSGSGDPLNANVPGCYADPGIYHRPAPPWPPPP